MIKHKDRTFFDEEIRKDRLAKKKDPLKPLKKKVNWLIFRTILENAFKCDPKAPGGRPRYDLIMMFKILVLQRLYNLSDEQVEFQIIDRYSFTEFLGLESQDDVPDQNTIWLFRETLIKKDKIKALFNKFNEHLKEKGILAQDGMIIDASFVEVPRQRNSREENEDIKNGKTPSDWDEKKQSHKDIDARWTKKNNVTFYGYKNHVKVNRGTKLIEDYEVSNAAVHDSQLLKKLVDGRDRLRKLWADSAYWSTEIRKYLKRIGIKDLIHERGVRGKELTETQMKRNRMKSKVRALVEHVFGYMENSMNRMRLRCIGEKRAAGNIGLMNLAYNLKYSLAF